MKGKPKRAAYSALRRGFGGQGVAAHRLAGKLRVGPDQCQLGLAAGCTQYLHHRVLELRQ
jgi:hypothetical protein